MSEQVLRTKPARGGKRVVTFEITEAEEAEIKQLQASINQRLHALEASLDRLDLETAASRR